MMNQQELRKTSKEPNHAEQGRWMSFLMEQRDHLIWLVTALLLFGFVALPGIDLSADHLPLGDHASNSILILEAKSFSLLHGHYSRVGFYHPGPYLFYVMAVGEFLFYDLIPLTRSPEAAHRLAVAAGNLVLLWLALQTLRAFARGPIVACLAIVLALSVTTIQMPTLASPWPPHMFVAPAILLVIALWASVCGHNTALWKAVMAAGILIHGHASNIGLMPIVFLLAIAAFLFVRRAFGESLSPSALYSWIKPQLGPVLLVTVTFAAPFGIFSVMNWPGELPKYFAQSGDVANSIVGALDYTLSYWQYWPWFIVFGLAAMSLRTRETEHAASQVPSDEIYAEKIYAKHIVALGLTFLALTAAMLFYAWRGVDDFIHLYVGFWYVGAVGGTIAIFAIIMLRVLPSAISVFAAACMFCFSLLGLFVINAPSWEKLNDLREPAERLLTDIAENSDGRRIPIVIDRNINGWQVNWQHVVGLLELDNRLSGNTICIESASWELLFHAESRCTEQEQSAAAAVLYASSGAVDETMYSHLANFGSVGVKLYQRSRLAPTEPYVVDLSTDRGRALSDIVLGEGWHSVEATHVWQSAGQSVLRIAAPAGETRSIKLDLQAFLPHEDSVLDVEVRLDDQVVDVYSFDSEVPQQVIEILLPPADKPSDHTVRLYTDSLASPAVEYPGNMDDRMLGVALRTIRID